MQRCCQRASGRLRWRHGRIPCQSRKGSTAFAAHGRAGGARGDIEESFVRSGGHGGQNVNKTATCVMLVHRPTGLQVKCQTTRHQGLNRFIARRLLLDKIERLRTGCVQAERVEDRKNPPPEAEALPPRPEQDARGQIASLGSKSRPATGRAGVNRRSSIPSGFPIAAPVVLENDLRHHHGGNLDCNGQARPFAEVSLTSRARRNAWANSTP